MDTIAVITPSRGRPASIPALAETIVNTATHPERIVLYVGVDSDDPDREQYNAHIDPDYLDAYVFIGEPRTLSGWTNLLAKRAILDGATWLASLGDDHRPRTAGWDEALIDAASSFDGPGIAYGDDLLQHEKLPTAWLQHAAVAVELGWMMLPVCEHLYVDAATIALGQAARRIAYRPDVVIEHMHPAAGKADMDPTYEAGNSAQRIAEDYDAYHKWLTSASGLTFDAAKVGGLRWPANHAAATA